MSKTTLPSAIYEPAGRADDLRQAAEQQAAARIAEARTHSTEGTK